MSGFRRTALVAALAVTTAALSAAVALPAPASAALPTAAVAIGDSFISGEGAGAYTPVVDINGVAQGFPGWTAPNSNAYFCHRWANASLHQANLPGVQARFNLACSGGQPYDIATASASRTKGRQDQVDADGQHRVVFQDYTNPLPFDLQSNFHSEDGRDDTRDKFRALGAERYAAGCPIHRASLLPGHHFSQGLGGLVKSTRDTLAAEFPAADLVYLNVQQAFNGARLCESAASPTGALATPIRLQGNPPTGTFVTSLSGKDKIAIQRIANTCATYFQTCQESWHPNAAGHQVLGQCLSGAAATAARAVACVRAADGSVTVS